MKTMIGKLKSVLVLGFIFSICCNSYSQAIWMQYSDSVKKNDIESVLKIPGVLTGNRYVLSIDEFNSFDKLDSKLDNVVVKSYSILTLGFDKGLIIKKCSGNEFDKTIKNILIEQPFLGYRIVIFDIVYNEIDNQKEIQIMKKNMDLTRAFILEIK